MSQKKKKIQWSAVIAIGVCLLLGIGFGLLLVRYMDARYSAGAEELGALAMAGLLAVLWVAFVVQIIVHEGGHLVFGLLSGYRFSSFRIFSLMWLREDGKLRFKRFSLAGTGGQCLMAPPELKEGRIPVVLYNLGGSLLNLVVSAGFLGLYFALGRYSYPAMIMLIFAVIGLIMALTNGIPLRVGGADTDGYNAIAMTRNQEAMYAFWVQLAVNEQTSKGVRLKDMPEEWFRVPSDEAMKNSMVAALGVYACNRLMDQERFREADQLMEHMMSIKSGMAGIHRNLMVCDRVYLELLGENRREVLEQLLDKPQKQFMKQMKSFPSVLRTEYAYALIGERDPAKAAQIKAQFDKVAKTYPYPVDIRTERRLMEIPEQRKQETVT